MKRMMKNIPQKTINIIKNDTKNNEEENAEKNSKISNEKKNYENLQHR